ncbi:MULTISPECIES: hypothetical protein [Okeania]|uniref:hypothetical protein n=1 Tax=Okeania TaxID=1458928 RepID=UPI000F53EB80|nr:MULTISPECIES: hypothetical protein [Okeania]NET15288.1 hypothetical protein [Okeania sp. SIO1H6]NET22374.1 hypothetical protein [Okeania sp. SIO1H5]NET77542.1 hypothetical protein [Okeania sp. SIO1F9]NET97117.1 hypothetical protein [Okeania sp. SIO1H2]
MFHLQPLPNISRYPHLPISPSNYTHATGFDIICSKYLSNWYYIRFNTYSSLLFDQVQNAEVLDNTNKRIDFNRKLYLTILKNAV